VACGSDCVGSRVDDPPELEVLLVLPSLEPSTALSVVVPWLTEVEPERAW